MVKLTLRSAARPRWALVGHSASTCGTLGSLESHSHFTLISLQGYWGSYWSHLCHLWSPWSSWCPGRAWWETCSCPTAGFHEALIVTHGFWLSHTFSSCTYFIWLFQGRETWQHKLLTSTQVILQESRFEKFTLLILEDLIS